MCLIMSQFAVLSNTVQQFYVCEPSETFSPPNKVKWEKVDKARYQSEVTAKLSELEHDALPLDTLDMQVRKINDILVQAANEARPKSVKRHRKARLTVWTPAMKDAVNAKKKAFWEWKHNNKPNQKDNVFVVNKKVWCCCRTCSVWR